jgi:signal transduction histidine kinase/ActR/RegA family two-component response regulator
MGIVLAAGFSWAALRLDTIEINLSNERMRAAEIDQMIDRLDVILTAADLTLNGGETYTAQWAASRARELAVAITTFREENPNYWPKSENRGFVDDLESLASLINTDPNVNQPFQNLLTDYDELARRLVVTIDDARQYSESRVESAELLRTQNASLIAASMIAGTLFFLLASIIASNYATRRIVKPLELLGSAAREEQPPNTRNPVLDTAPAEILQVAGSFADFTDTLTSKVKERTSQLEATTDQLTAENRRRRQVEADLQVALEESRTASAAKTAFLSVMSHELRTPMNAVMGALHIIKSEPLSDHQKELVNTARDAGDFLVGLLTDVLDISKIESDGVEIEEKPVEIRPFLKRLERQVAVQVGSADCSWSMAIDEDLPEWILIDQNRVQQILTNFIGNACKFAPASVLKLTVQRLEQETIASVRFSLADRGPGIGKEHLESIFEPFNQVESNLDREAGGVGLGLSICKRLAVAMSGTCGVHSTLGEGSTFFFELPCRAIDPPADKRRIDRQATSETSARLKAETELEVLLVEDSKVNQMIARTMLEKRGVEVITVESGYAAIEIAAQRRFDVVLMDLQMPGMDGITAATTILEADGPNEKTPIIPMTANVGPEFQNQTLDAGMTGFIPKPLKPEAMMDAIYAALRQAQIET